VTKRNARSRQPGPGPAEGRQLPRWMGGRRHAADPASTHCPYLRPAGGDEWVLAGSSPGDRCHMGEQSTHVGEAYAKSVCRTTDHQSCRRFAANAQVAVRVHADAAARGRRLLRAGIPSVLSVEEPAAGPAQASALEAPRPGRHSAPMEAAAPAPERSRRRVGFLELIVVSLGTSILFTCLFIGYALFYRVQIRGGIEAAAPPRILSATARPEFTLVPTFTPTSLPTAIAQVVANTAAPAPPPATPPATPEPVPVRPTPAPVVRPPAVSPPTRLVIPAIDLDIPVVPVGIRIAAIAGRERVVWSDVPDAGAFHETSAYPGNPGNTVINGHRDILGSVFRHLDRLETGDQILLYVGEQVYPYFVTETLVVPDTFASAEQRAENAKLIGYYPEERLTLVTCTPVGLGTHRLLVIAKPLARVAPRILGGG
jgi:LPXTG-site transpeptidase (sortase) family protein